MSGPRRRELPDNLDPLVDTLSNVVGILVIVIALTQLELSEALARVARIARQASESVPRVEAALAPDLLERRDRLVARAGAKNLDEAVARIESRLAEFEAGRDGPGEGDSESDAAAGLGSASRAQIDAAAADGRVDARAEAELERLGGELARERAEDERARTADVHRRAYARGLERVPAQLVARLPDPHTFEGREAWLLVRHGRVYPVDREALFERGRKAITRILPDGGTRQLRPDELESAALYLRKQDVGLGNVRWELETEPSLRAVLRWRTRDGGIERSRLAEDPGLRDWLAALRPERDAIRFHVWTDSFETYLEARTLVEAAGFHAGWQGHERDEELVTGLRFGPRLPEVRPRAVD